ncbi:MAG: hypothetical protein ETSY2_08235 [Candidatus Entotheonella gemina]|uniref:Uncharacterized protein n=1 Tax=Candidatus Entotheonella gemina TaxID=1429439 RepID=W4MDE7_9BACT|nr:MAG: hypothetical protein ETSY2_08235 [Candidatus Entotheonella gemina]
MDHDFAYSTCFLTLNLHIFLDAPPTNFDSNQDGSAHDLMAGHRL